MSHRSIYLGVSIPNFSIQNCLRFDPELKGSALAIHDDEPPLKRILALNDLAASLGAFVGMSYAQAGLINELVLVPRAPAEEDRTKQNIVRECMRFTSRVEDCSKQNECVLLLDVTESIQLFSNIESLAYGLDSALRAEHVCPQMAASYNFHTTLLLAYGARSKSLIHVPFGQEQASVADLPVALLPVTDDQAAAFTLWGIRTLKDLSSLPRADLVSRMGLDALRLVEIARGCHPHVFVPLRIAAEIKESVHYDSPVCQIESLLFTLSDLLKQLLLRVTDELMAIASLTATAIMDNGGQHVRLIRPSAPSINHKLLLKLVQLDLDEHPPACGIVGLILSAELGKLFKTQLGLFSLHLPEPSQLDLTLARLAAVAGPANVGSPRLENSHRQTAIRLDRFTVSGYAPLTGTDSTSTVLAIRRMRALIRTRLSAAGAPLAFVYSHVLYAVDCASGPWISNGHWWNRHPWGLETWDVTATHTLCNQRLHCILSYDPGEASWQLEGVYD